MKIITQIILIFLIGYNASAQQQIPNGNFENWTNGDAESWNSVSLSAVDQTSDAMQGNYAVKLTSQSVVGQFIPGLITLGEIDIYNQTMSGGKPYTDRPDGVSFFFKYQPSGIDTMFFGCFLTKWNTVDLQADTIGVTGYINSDTYNSYTEVELPFIYRSTEIPDTLNIIFTSSGFSGNSGSLLYIDSLSMKNGIILSPTLCFQADEISSSGFKAHWLSVPNAENYIIDVSENSDFSSFVSGYEDLNIGIDTFYIVNAAPGTYFYRVRVNYTDATSINSNTIEVVTENTEINNFNLEDYKIISSENTVIIKNSENKINRINAYNISGQLIKSFINKNDTIQLSFKTPGIYIIEIISTEKIFRKKINLVF